MYIHGSFLTNGGSEVTVYILTRGSRAQELEIGSSGWLEEGTELQLFFDEDPVTIQDEVNDTFDVLLRQSASIRLLCSQLVRDLFCTAARDAVVNIYRDGSCIFAGYLEPQAYSQPYSEVYDQLELNCIDALSALQYGNYKDIGAPGVLYAAVKAEATQRTFADIMREILDGVTSSLDILGGTAAAVYYDGSKALDAAEDNRYGIFSQVSINELLFLGDDEDNVWKQESVLEEMLKYLGLHIRQDGLGFYIFSWESVHRGAGFQWRDLFRGSTKKIAGGMTQISTEKVADTDCSVSMGEAFNQLLLTCTVEGVDNVVESPLDDGSIDSPYSWWQQYMTEYSADGEGKRAYNAFYAMTHGEHTDFGEGTVTDWFLQVMRNQKWTFYGQGGIDLMERFCKDGRDQHALADWLGTNRGTALLSLGSVKKRTANDDNSPTSKVDMTTWLVVTVNGNGVDTQTGCRPSEADIKACIPCAVYNGKDAGGVFSPADETTTNYIVITGSMVLNPLMEMTDTYKTLHEAGLEEWSLSILGKGWWHQTVPSRNNGDGRYYTNQYWRAGSPKDSVVWNQSVDRGFYPYTGEGPQQYEFKYSAIGDGTDKVSKVAVLACMLVIGDKCVVETGTQGQPSDFQWRKYKRREECQDDDEYYQQSFTIGFDPKIGDKLIGTEFQMQNNITYQMGLNEEGIAIPIRMGDKVAGDVQFQILGPVNTLWSEWTRRHKTFFRHTKWSENVVPLLAHTSSIMLKNFEVKVMSDNGFFSSADDSADIVYMSDTKETFLNRKDDLEMKISSALTAEEQKNLGVGGGIRLSTPLNAETGLGLLTVYDHNSRQQDKPEHLYVDAGWREWHEPRVVMEVNLQDGKDEAVFLSHFLHPALGTRMFVQGMGRELESDTLNLTLKEIPTEE